VKDRHGIQIISGPLPFFGEGEEETRLISHSIPRPIRDRGYRIAKGWHYPSHVLYRLQKGRCFFCGEPIDNRPCHRGVYGGYMRTHFYPKESHYPLWGNKVLAHPSCRMFHKSVPLVPELVARFDRLYSPAVFAAEFETEEIFMMKGGM